MADKYTFTDYNAMVGKLPRQTYWKELQDAVNAEAVITADKVDKVAGKQLSTEDYTTIEKTKLSGIAENANNYTHPANHSLDMITETTGLKVMTSAERTKLSGIEAGAEVNVGTNIAQGTRTTTTVPITSSTGSNATLDVATASLAGVMSSADKTKLNGIDTGAQVNTVTSVATKTGAVTLAKGDVGLGNVDDVQQIPMTQKGANNGVATLDGSGKVPHAQLPEIEGMVEHNSNWHTEGYEEGIRTSSNQAFNVEVRTSDPVAPAVGRMWLRSDL